MIDAAMERTAAGIAADVPPYARIRASIGLPTTALWINRTERAGEHTTGCRAGWKLADYLRAERIATDAAEGGAARDPAHHTGMRIALTTEEPPPTRFAGVAIWALQRWGVAHVRIAMPEDAHDEALPNALAGAGITAQTMSGKTAPAGTAMWKSSRRPRSAATSKGLARSGRREGQRRGPARPANGHQGPTLARSSRG
jgi:hypothetical protein